jgi:hypothetical protein
MYKQFQVETPVELEAAEHSATYHVWNQVIWIKVKKKYIN